MLGVTVVFMDNIILTWFAKHSTGDISRLRYAKHLFTAPMAIIGQAAGAASLPFFASLYSRKLFDDYAAAVNRAVSRIFSVALIALGRHVCAGAARGRPDLSRRLIHSHRCAASRPSTSRSSPSRSLSGHRRPSTRAPSSPPARPFPMRRRNHRHGFLHAHVLAALPPFGLIGLASHPTSESSCRPDACHPASPQTPGLARAS